MLQHLVPAITVIRWKRDPEKVLKDVREKKVSAEAAKKEYGVVVVSDGVDYHVDEQATKALRG